MASPGEEVVAFLHDNGGARGRELEVAIVYAALMVDELRASVADWEATVELLRRLKCRSQCAGAGGNSGPVPRAGRRDESLN